MSDILCRRCQRAPGTVYYEGNMFCVKCANLFGTCAMCKHHERCNFNEYNEMPDVVVKHIRQQTPHGYIEKIIQGPNADKIKITCMGGKCICCNDNQEDPRCMRQYGVCASYDEIEFEGEKEYDHF